MDLTTAYLLARVTVTRRPDHTPMLEWNTTLGPAELRPLAQMLGVKIEVVRRPKQRPKGAGSALSLKGSCPEGGHWRIRILLDDLPGEVLAQFPERVRRLLVVPAPPSRPHRPSLNADAVWPDRDRAA